MFDSLLTSPTPSVPELPYYTRNKVSQRGFNSMKLRQTRGFSSYKLQVTRQFFHQHHLRQKRTETKTFDKKSVLNFPPPLLISAPKKQTFIVNENQISKGLKKLGTFWKTTVEQLFLKHVALLEILNTLF